MSSFPSGSTWLLMLLPVLFLAFSRAVISLATLPADHHFPLPPFAILTCCWLGKNCFRALKLLLYPIRQFSKLPKCRQKVRQTWWLHEWQWSPTQARPFCWFLRLLSSQLTHIISEEPPFTSKFSHAFQVLFWCFVIQIHKEIKHTCPRHIWRMRTVATKAPLTRVPQTSGALIAWALKHSK